MRRRVARRRGYVYCLYCLNCMYCLYCQLADADARAEEARQRAELYRSHWEERQAYVSEMEASTMR